jgi:hypothetical protein
VMALREVSLLTPATDGACGPAVSVHRLVQAVMRGRLAERSEAGRAGALAALVRAFPGDAFRHPTNWPRCRAADAARTHPNTSEIHDKIRFFCC